MIIDFSKDYVLENEVVLLRPLSVNDFDNILPFSLQEPELWKYSLIPGNGEENLKKYFDLALSSRQHKTSYTFIVFDKRTNEYAGMTRFYDIQTEHNTAQLGYTWYGSKFQGTGLNKSCKYLMLQFAFSEIGLDRVEFRADNNNERSISAMKSLGCTVEGILRSNCSSPTGRRDSIVLSILKDEWFKNLESKLNNELKN
jgi:RimJ/RimL family protein N-acetyltransferase